ncbi:MAG TPA: hypothetical protein VLK65_28595 [Vicinamibacteria bacterium]|nr:hypothetical protein [Vicinamibacteria bacterium]
MWFSTVRGQGFTSANEVLEVVLEFDLVSQVTVVGLKLLFHSFNFGECAAELVFSLPSHDDFSFEFGGALVHEIF